MRMMRSVALLALMLAACTTIGPGYVGIKVNKLGDSRGVQDLALSTGIVTYSPFTSAVFEYPVFTQTAAWVDTEAPSFNSKEGLAISGDVSLSYQLKAEKVPAFYVKFRSDNLSLFTHGYMRNVARDAFNEVAGKYAVDELYGPRKDDFLRDVRTRINAEMAPYGVELTQLGFIGAPKLPAIVVSALNAKLEAQQVALRTQNEVMTAQAEAKKNVAIAEGQAQSQIATARGEAEANKLRSVSITEQMLRWRTLEIQQQAIDKWNGTVPTYLMGDGGKGGILQMLPIGGK